MNLVISDFKVGDKIAYYYKGHPVPGEQRWYLAGSFGTILGKSYGMLKVSEYQTCQIAYVDITMVIEVLN